MSLIDHDLGKSCGKCSPNTLRECSVVQAFPHEDTHIIEIYLTIASRSFEYRERPRFMCLNRTGLDIKAFLLGGCWIDLPRRSVEASQAKCMGTRERYNLPIVLVWD
ncbi:hypothetical protein AN416_38835 (plasmid) [Paraburkholderia caribensis]|nr:hypothetical protein AN416_38835 [Paraburkholderia caribensis]